MLIINRNVRIKLDVDGLHIMSVAVPSTFSTLINTQIIFFIINVLILK